MKRAILLSLLIVFTLVSCAVPEDPAPSTSTDKSATISKGAGSQDASADVKLVSFKKIDEGYGLTSYKGQLLITNHSAKPSDYYVELKKKFASSDDMAVAHQRDRPQ